VIFLNFLQWRIVDQQLISTTEILFVELKNRFIVMAIKFMTNSIGDLFLRIVDRMIFTVAA